MRDINRIDTVMTQLTELWKKYPDLRLGQLISNVVRDPALYYVEDTELISKLNKFYGVK